MNVISRCHGPSGPGVHLPGKSLTGDQAPEWPGGPPSRDAPGGHRGSQNLGSEGACAKAPGDVDNTCLQTKGY